MRIPLRYRPCLETYKQHCFAYYSCLLTVSIIGLGVVGLSTAALFASGSIRVIGVENNNERFNKIKEGEPGFYEPKLKRMLNDALKKGLLTISKDIYSAVKRTKF